MGWQPRVGMVSLSLDPVYCRDGMGRAGFTYNSDSVVVEVGLLVELLLELSVLLDWPIGVMLANRPHGDDELMVRR
jgi:hypothetical protein